MDHEISRRTLSFIEIDFMLLEVESRLGEAGDHIPLAFYLGRTRIEVISIIDQWLSWEYSYFKLKADEGSEYILKHDKLSDHWELTMYGPSP